MDVYEDTDAIVIKTDLPGVSQDEIDIEMNNDMLTIRGERKFDDEGRRDKYVRVERQYGAFSAPSRSGYRSSRTRSRPSSRTASWS